MAIKPDTRQWLTDAFGHRVTFKEPMSKHTSLRVGGPAEAYVIPENVKALEMLVSRSTEQQIPYMVVGAGTNLLVKDNGITGIVIDVSECLDGITITRTDDDTVYITAMAGTRMQSLCGFAIDRGFEGMNFAIGIPGTVGGGIIMNAGTAIGRMEDSLKHITVLIPPNETKLIAREQLKFDYRKLSFGDDGNWVDQKQIIILDGCFCLHRSDPKKLREEASRILKERKKKQPIDLPSAGCFFKNPMIGKTAGELIDLAGLKGKRLGGAAVSTKHANFIVNSGNASAADFIALINMVQKAVSETFGIQLETEVIIVGK